MGEDVEQTKRRLRQRLLAARRDLSADTAARLATAVCAHVAGWHAFATAHHVVAYAAVENEVDPQEVVDTALEAGKAVYFPRVARGDLEFLRAEPTRLKPGHHGIPEPSDGVPLVPGTPAVLFLVPGVAFDTCGVRLGRGGGCYDRALARHAQALRVGLAYEMQVVQSLPETALDVRMHAVATEARLVETGAQEKSA